MSAIYGLVRFDGGSVEASELTAMADAIRYWGPDGGATWTSPSATVGLGQLVSHNLPESVRENGPIELGDGTVITASARLDNRDELLLTLGLRPDATESAIVAGAWQKWGREAPSHLFGDWAFAAWDPSSRRLFIARDQFGMTALYHHRNGSTFAFASSRKALFALPFVPRRLNELRLAQHLATWVTDGEATFHEEIFRLPPGHHLTASHEGVTVTRSWFPENVPEVRLRSDAEYVERFLELYSTAVRVRTRTSRQVVSTLSSGLDSGSVTALAARELRAQGKPLIAFTSVPLYPEIASFAPRVVVDEWELARSSAQWIGSVDHRALRTESITPIASLERSLWLHDEPEYAAANLYWLLDVLGQSRAAGAGVLLTGQMGNGGVSWSGDQQRVIRGIMRGQWLDAWRGLRAFQQVRRTSLPRAASAQIVRPLRMKIATARFLSGRIDAPFSEEMMAPEFARRISVFDRMRGEGYDPFHSNLADPLTQRLRVLLPRINPIGALWNESGAGYGLEARDPTADVRLLEYCLGVPDDQFVRAGNDRFLMRRSLEGLLPPAVQWNQRRGRQGADLVLRMRVEAGSVGAAVDEVTSSPIVGQFMNVDAIREMWTDLLEKNDAGVLSTANVLARALLIALFLAREPFHAQKIEEAVFP